MSKKKKKKKKKSISILKEVDKTLDHSYDDLMEEIQEMQLMLNLADQKARKKAKKAKKKHNTSYEYEYNRLRKEAREVVVNNMSGSSFLERVSKVLEDIAPIIITISRLVAALILSILSIDAVKTSISPKMLDMLNKVYQKAMAVA